jgi:hypothetical protein
MDEYLAKQGAERAKMAKLKSLRLAAAGEGGREGEGEDEAGRQGEAVTLH